MGRNCVLHVRFVVYLVYCATYFATIKLLIPARCVLYSFFVFLMCLADAVVWSSLYPVLASESAGSGGKGQECMEVGCMHVESIYSCVYVLCL